MYKTHFMINFLETASPEAIAVSATGKITLDEYQKASPIILGKMATYGKVPFMLSISKIDTHAAKHVWKDIRNDLKHVEGFKKIAVVVDSLKFKLFVQMAKPFIPAEVKVFGKGEEDAALQWILKE